MCANSRCLRIWPYYKSCPEVLLETSIPRIWKNWAGYRRLDAWARVMTLDMGVVCYLLHQAIGPGYVALYTLGRGGSMVCVTLDLVRHTMG